MIMEEVRISEGGEICGNKNEPRKEEVRNEAVRGERGADESGSWAGENEQQQRSGAGEYFQAEATDKVERGVRETEKRKRGRPKKKETNRDVREFFGSLGNLEGASEVQSPPMKKGKCTDNNNSGEEEEEQGEGRQEKGENNGGVYDWMSGIQEAEIRMRGTLRNSLTELEIKMKQWWREELKQIQEEYERDGEVECEGCEESRRKIEEYENTIREMKKEAERDKTKWGEERSLLLKIISRLESRKEGHEKDETKGKDPEDRNGRLKVVRGASGKIAETDRRGDGIDGASGQEEVGRNAKETGRGMGEARGGWQEVRRERRTGKTDGNNNHMSVIENERKREIGRRKPVPIGEREWKEERNRRETRRNNINVSFRESEENKKESVLKKIEERCRQEIRRQTITKHVSRGEMVLKFKNWTEKLEIMRKRKELKGTGIWIKDDLSRREKEIQNWLRDVAENERRRGRQAEVKYMKIWMEDMWWRWNERKGDIEIWRYAEESRQPFRNEQGGQR